MDLVRLLTLELMLLLLLGPRDFGLLGVGLRFCSPTAMECLLGVGDGGFAVVPFILSETKKSRLSSLKLV